MLVHLVHVVYPDRHPGAIVARFVSVVLKRGGVAPRPDTLVLNNELNLVKLLVFAPTQTERDEADDLAMEYLAHLKGYEPQDLETAAIFLYTASEACKTKPSLLTPRFGDGLPGCGRNAHISRMALAAPPGADQNPAMHIGLRTDVDPWSETVRLHGTTGTCSFPDYPGTNGSGGRGGRFRRK